MATGKRLCARVCLGIIICFTGLSYWLVWHSGVRRPMFISSWLRLETNRSSSCLYELLFAFGIDTLNLSTPTYVRLPQPVPIVSQCSHLFVKPNGSMVNFTKPEHLNSEQQLIIHSIMNQLTVNFSKQHLELFLAGGSLLGSVRHFGFFPWDGDADVMIPTNQKAKARQFLIDLSSSDQFRFADTERGNGHWQLGIFCHAVPNKTHTRVYGTKKLYPEKQCKTIVDFFFGWTDKKWYFRREHPRSFPISDVYPLRLMPYGPYLLPAPRRPEKFLSAVYGTDYEKKCLMKYFGYKTFNCSSLRSIYQFVTHLRLFYKHIELQVNILVHDSNMLAIFIPPVF